MEIAEDAPLTHELIRQRAERLMARLRVAAEEGGHDPDRLRLVAVTKTWPAAVCRATLQAGIERLGENRVQEAEPKVAELPEADWHLVGRLQSNKVRRAVRLFSTIHSVDSPDLLRRVDRIAGEEDSRCQALLQVNLSGEPTHAGVDPAWLAAQAAPRTELVELIGALGAARLAGLMTIGRFGAPEPEARAAFRRLRELRDALEQASGIGLPELSMGMTADAGAAAAEGATLVRIGTALFGPRRD